MKILIDTNVILDRLVTREPFAECSKQILVLCKQKKVHGCIAAHSVSNIFFILRKDFSADERRNILKTICSYLEVVGIDKVKILSALDNNGFADFEDCLQAECASDFNADYVITRNVKDFKASKIPAITPDDFLERLEK